MKKLREMKRPQVSTIIACLALFVAIGGTATAASGLINGKKIKKGTITAKQIKNKTITTGKIAPSTLSALVGPKGEKGAQGEKGAAGQQGPQGVAGQQGPQGLPGGTITTYFESDDSPNNVAANTETEVINMNGLAPGRYIITVSVQAFSAGAGLVQCDLATNGGGGSAGGMFTAAANGRAVIAMNRVTATAGVTQLDVDCQSSGANSSYSADVTAVKTTP